MICNQDNGLYRSSRVSEHNSGLLSVLICDVFYGILLKIITNKQITNSLAAGRGPWAAGSRTGSGRPALRSPIESVIWLKIEPMKASETVMQ